MTADKKRPVQCHHIGTSPALHPNGLALSGALCNGGRRPPSSSLLAAEAVPAWTVRRPRHLWSSIPILISRSPNPTPASRRPTYGSAASTHDEHSAAHALEHATFDASASMTARANGQNTETHRSKNTRQMKAHQHEDEHWHTDAQTQTHRDAQKNTYEHTASTQARLRALFSLTKLSLTLNHMKTLSPQFCYAFELLAPTPRRTTTPKGSRKTGPSEQNCNLPAFGQVFSHTPKTKSMSQEKNTFDHT